VSSAAIPSITKKGRPRSERAERAILEATVQLLDESGLTSMTIEEVAARAGVGKASIYRRWPSKGTLALDAFLGEFLDGQPVRDTGSLRGDLLAAVRDWIRTVNGTPAGRTLSGIIAEVQNDPHLAAEWRERFVRPVREKRRPIIDRAVARGEIPRGSDPDLLLDMLYGPIYHRYLNGHLPLSDRFARGVASMVASAAGAGAAVAAPRGDQATRGRKAAVEATSSGRR
jgi:AcrR family transcriptional regulator